jgi:hypothetical protein
MACKYRTETGFNDGSNPAGKAEGVEEQDDALAVEALLDGGNGAGISNSTGTRNAVGKRDAAAAFLFFINQRKSTQSSCHPPGRARRNCARDSWFVDAAGGGALYAVADRKALARGVMRKLRLGTLVATLVTGVANSGKNAKAFNVFPGEAVAI